MLFNSYEFLFAYLPAALALVWVCNQFGTTRLRTWGLLLASLAFYSWWAVQYLPVLLGSIFLNYGASWLMARRLGPRSRGAAVVMWTTVIVNLLLLGYFKYLLFFTEMVVGTGEAPSFVQQIVLPLGISFFTFHQIAYVVDVWKNEVEVDDFGTYALFVSFFPQLIAGPIVRYQQMGRQLTHPSPPMGTWFAPGAFLFTVGLFKKVMIADNLAGFADAVFKRAEVGTLGFEDAWIGALAYTFQLYFDFSGYSDMALGLALLLGFRLTMNFDSPYRASSIIDFWRRWHISLSNFFRDFVYIPLGGNRHGKGRQITILIFVMVLVGFWHGAGWTFIAWGALHGALLGVAHLTRLIPGAREFLGRLSPLTAALTFVAVVIGWVIFRAPTLAVAQTVISGMFTLGGMRNAMVNPAYYSAAISLIVVSAAICFILPNAARIAGMAVAVPSLMHDSQRDANELRWPKIITPVNWLSPLLLVVLAAMIFLCAATIGTTPSTFLYYQF